MPLVIPGIQSNNDNKSGISKDEWQNKLAGKLLGEKHDEIVRPLFLILPLPFALSPSQWRTKDSSLHADTHRDKRVANVEIQTFAKTDLPKNHRVLKPDSMKTMNYDENRLNIHLDAEDRVHEVTTG
jgi:hypothetical protein